MGTSDVISWWKILEESVYPSKEYIAKILAEGNPSLKNLKANPGAK